MARSAGSGAGGQEAAVLADLDRGAAAFFLFYGADESEVDRIARIALERALGGPDGERIDLTGTLINADPARLADEAAAMSLFGGKRAIRLTIGREDVSEAVGAMLDQPGTDSPVIATAGNLNATSKLVKLAQSHRRARLLSCSAPGVDAVQKEIVAAGAREGLVIGRDAAERIGAMVEHDRLLARLEVEKLALYLDADPAQPKPLDPGAIDRLGAAREEDDVNRLAAVVMGGEAAAIRDELAHVRAHGVNDVSIVRALMRRVQQVARGRVWGDDKALNARTATAWPPRAAAQANDRLLRVEAALMSGGSPIELEQLLFGLARAAARAGRRPG